jgi:hypothetical protein
MAVPKMMTGVMLAGLALAGADARAGEALPPIATLTATSDYSRFMQPDVPPAVRAAALARLWVLDPVIRGGEGTARDGDWNWNAADGVPGCGAAPSTAEVRATLEALHRRLDRVEDAANIAAARGGHEPGSEHSL